MFGNRALAVALVVVAAFALMACGDGDSGDDTSDLGIGADPDTTITLDDGDLSDDSSSGASGSSSGDGDFMTVFGLPPGNSVETDWSPYTRQESEFGVTESVVFEVTGATLDEIISYYETTLPAMGYEVGPRLELGDSIAINVSDPNNAATTAVVQAGPTGDVITVNQNKTVPATATETTQAPPDSAVSSGDMSSEGG